MQFGNLEGPAGAESSGTATVFVSNPSRSRGNQAALLVKRITKPLRGATEACCMVALFVIKVKIRGAIFRTVTAIQKKPLTV